MSAIFGILDLKGRPIDPSWIKSMQEDLSHRGPDGQGLYREDSLVLGNMLLQVTPESVYDKSPYEADGLVITANARLDEREALMDRLGIMAAEREKITDPLLLLRSYKKWGKDFVKDIYGDFSFAIWDKENKELFCARDQMGVKPFLYYFQDDRFVFSTELKSIVRLPFVKTEIDHLYLRDLCLYILADPRKTSWKNIERLQSAHKLALDGFNLSITKYWTPKYKRNKQFKTEEDSAAALKKELEKVIADHTRVIGGVGVPLSGGLDSSTIACLAACKLNFEGKKITTASSIYNPDFSDPKNPDEMEYINEVIKQEKNIDPTFVFHSEHEFINGLKKTFDQQYAPVNYFYYVDEALYKQFRTKSIRRVLSGYLGDLTASNITIYPFTYLLLQGRWPTLFKLIGQTKLHINQSLSVFIKSGILNELAPNLFQKAWNKIKSTYHNPLDISELPLKLTSKERVALQKKVLTAANSSNIYLSDISHNIWPKNNDLFQEDWDCGSSQQQIEITYPLADRRIVELLHQIPVEHFYAGGIRRGLLRKAMMGVLPEKIRLRKGKGGYSPGYPNIIKNELTQIKKILHGASSDKIDQLLDIEKLKFELENLSTSKNNDSFDYKSCFLIDIFIWVYFSKPDYLSVNNSKL